MTTYKVTGNTPFMGHEPGDTFDDDLDEALEARAVERGSITVEQTTKKKKEEEPSDA
jgi:hypothetical protein